MNEFKVGDRVRLFSCRRYGTIIKEKEIWCSHPHYLVSFEDDGSECLMPEIDLETVDKNGKTLDQQKIDQLEQRIEKLEKCSGMGKYATDRKENVSNFEKTTQKSNLLTEDDLPTHNRINELEDLKYFRDKGYIWTCKDENGAIHIFKIKPTIYNIEELLKGECGNE